MWQPQPASSEHEMVVPQPAALVRVPQHAVRVVEHARLAVVTRCSERISFIVLRSKIRQG